MPTTFVATRFRIAEAIGVFMDKSRDEAIASSCFGSTSSSADARLVNQPLVALWLAPAVTKPVGSPNAPSMELLKEMRARFSARFKPQEGDSALITLSIVFCINLNNKTIHNIYKQKVHATHNSMHQSCRNVN